MNAEQIREAIREKQRLIEALEGEIDELAKGAIPGFHFMSHKVSTFWDCDKSPIGMCVWDVRQRGFHFDCSCHYCHGPVERK